jgi:hypothetical protein
MRYLKSIVAGVIVAILAAVVWVIAVFVIPIAWSILVARFYDGAGFAAASVTSGSILAAALVGFVLGFVWRFRRAPALARGK